jgi:hypothetical protein
MEDNKNQASIIIDDPLLRENYGFLNYRKLLSLMDEHNFCTTIAFIPWNYNRTDDKVAALFRERPDRFSLCVHGCDHTQGEFGGTDGDTLDKIVKLATARMTEHEKRTGISFARVMVFPQGIFSNSALEVLKKNDYWAAVNTTASPVNDSMSSDFPFYLRHTPEDVLNSLSNPAFVVLHHDYFKNGYKKLTDFVDHLNSEYRNMSWDSVGNIVRHRLSIKELQPSDAIKLDLTGHRLHGYKRNAKISMRRYASEFRDNYLSKNEFLLKYAKEIKSLLKSS